MCWDTISEIFEHLFGVSSQAVGPSRRLVHCCSLKSPHSVPLVSGLSNSKTCYWPKPKSHLTSWDATSNITSRLRSSFVKFFSVEQRKDVMYVLYLIFQGIFDVLCNQSNKNDNKTLWMSKYERATSCISVASAFSRPDLRALHIIWHDTTRQNLGGTYLLYILVCSFMFEFPCIIS